MRDFRAWDVDRFNHISLLDNIQFLDEDIGLVDSNGVKIFENDIVEFSPKYSSYRSLGIITYMKQYAAYSAASPVNKRFHHLLYNGLIQDNGVCEHLTVIGNIHENQDILDNYRKFIQQKSEIKSNEK